MTRIVAISDTHSQHGRLKIPECDILIHSGDFMTDGMRFQEIKVFNDWAGDLLHEGTVQHAVLVAGNHDLLLDPAFAGKYGLPVQTELLSNWCYLNNSGVELCGLKIYGYPEQPEFYNWGFNAPRESMYEYVSKIPLDTDILVTHGPPQDYGDETYTGEHVGCEFLTERLELSLHVKLVVCGHIHHAYGEYLLKNKYGNSTTVLNASSCNERYQPVNAPLVFEL